MKRNVALLVVLAICLLPAVYLLIVWESLPETVPVHFGADMQPDRMGSKGELWFPVGIIALVSFLLYLLFRNIHKIDPKRRHTAPSQVFLKLAFGLVVFMSVLNLLIILLAQGYTVFQNFMFPLIGLMFAFIGNYMYHIKPNYFAGVRLPWTLSSDDNWKKTHLLAGKIWFAGGILITVMSFLMPPEIFIYFFIAIILVLVVVPIVYSYRLFKKEG